MPYKDSEKQKAYDRKYYQENKAAIRARVSERWARNRAAFFEGKCCGKCGSTDSLELDHIDPATKDSNRIWGMV